LNQYILKGTVRKLKTQKGVVSRRKTGEKTKRLREKKGMHGNMGGEKMEKKIR